MIKFSFTILRRVYLQDAKFVNKNFIMCNSGWIRLVVIWMEWRSKARVHSSDGIFPTWIYTSLMSITNEFVISNTDGFQLKEYQTDPCFLHLCQNLTHFVKMGDFFCFSLENWQNNFSFTTCTEHIWLSNFGLIKEIMGLLSSML